ncbi:MAG: diaminopimelate epimerase [Actinomycetota bacterium]
MVKEISFSKLNGQGNDFILIDDTHRNIDLDSKQIARMCDRHFGIGADGLIIVQQSDIADYRMAYSNADGSVAEMCGNGIRCMARFLYEAGICTQKEIEIETLAGIKKITMETTGGRVGKIRVNMGKPAFKPSQIPADIDGEEVFGYSLKAEGKVFSINLVSMGNPHCIVLTEKEKLAAIDLKKWGPALENHPAFPRKINVEFISIAGSREVEMRVWERGVGETLACGTGACAAAVAAVKTGKVKTKKVEVRVPGGVLGIIWDDEGFVYLEGTVSYVFDGKYIDR